MSNPDGCESRRSERVAVYILAGGRSRRFGSDKARVVVGGKPAILALADELGGGGRPITVVARTQNAYSDLGLRTIADVIPEKGPLGGVLTALEDVGHDRWVFIAACDWRGVRGEWVRLLVDAKAPRGAVLYDSPRKQPLFGLYHASLRDAVRERIERNQLAMMAWLGDVDITWVPTPAGWDDAFNMNEPE